MCATFIQRKIIQQLKGTSVTYYILMKPKTFCQVKEARHKYCIFILCTDLQMDRGKAGQWLGQVWEEGS